MTEHIVPRVQRSFKPVSAQKITDFGRHSDKLIPVCRTAWRDISCVAYSERRLLVSNGHFRLRTKKDFPLQKGFASATAC